MHVISLISSKKRTLLLNGKGIDNSTENLSVITDGHQNYEGCECKVTIVVGKISKTSNL